MKRGVFITFEGLDGAGKSTQAALLAEWLRQTRGLQVVETREPGGTEIGEKIRELAMATTGLNAVTETLLMLAARREHICRRIEPALAEGAWVLCDRFSDSTFAYQGGGRGVERRWIAEILRQVEDGLRPALTFYLQAPPEASSIPLLSGDVFENQQHDFYRAVAAEYRQLTAEHRQRIVTIKGRNSSGKRRDKKAIAADIQQTVVEKFPS